MKLYKGKTDIVMYTKQLKDYIKFICASLPYRLKCKCLIVLTEDTFSVVSVDMDSYPELVMVRLKGTGGNYVKTPIEHIKLLLRPFSSLTEIEQDVFYEINRFESREVPKNAAAAEWCLENHIDTKGFIGTSLAEESPENTYSK